MKRLSIIVPMYNVESYVERCLRSLEDQDLSKNDYEIICINDGSPDNCRGVVLKIQQEFDNIVLIDQENQGVSKARNNGIEKACGKYLLFIDPDDYVDPNVFMQILNSADRQKVQVSFLGYTVLNEEGVVKKEIFNYNRESRIYKGTEAYFLARGDGRTDPDRMVAVLFEMGFFNQNNLRYLPDVPYLEDGEFIARILCLAKRCIFDSNSFYQRTLRLGSATKSDLFYTDKAVNGFLVSANNLRRFQKEQQLNDEQMRFINQPICKFVLLALNSALQAPYIKKYNKIRKQLIVNDFKKIALEGVVKPYVYYAQIYNCFTVAFLLNAFVKEIKEKLK